jgi:hypothetical protein
MCCGCGHHIGISALIGSRDGARTHIAGHHPSVAVSFIGRRRTIYDVLYNNIYIQYSLSCFFRDHKIKASSERASQREKREETETETEIGRDLMVKLSILPRTSTLGPRLIGHRLGEHAADAQRSRQSKSKSGGERMK